MHTARLFFCLFLLAPPIALALDTTQVSTEQLHQLARELAPRAGPGQWQQLWQNMRRAGYFSAHPGQLQLVVPQSEVPALARQTLAQANQVEALDTARARYRKDFTPQIIGQRGSHRFNALCLEVDWRAVPQSQVHAPTAYLGMVGLLEAYPCR